jgi:hypothetical protein
MLLGFLWTPRHTPRKRVVVEAMFEEMRDLHWKVGDFYMDKKGICSGTSFYMIDPSDS